MERPVIELRGHILVLTAPPVTPQSDHRHAAKEQVGIWTDRSNRVDQSYLPEIRIQYLTVASDGVHVAAVSPGCGGGTKTKRGLKTPNSCLSKQRR